MATKIEKILKQYILRSCKKLPGRWKSTAGQTSGRWFFILSLLIMIVLACVTNTPVAQISTPRPTRTPLPTFTLTPIPPSPTPVPTNTITPTPTDTPLPTDTPTPTDTPIPPTDVPTPTDTPVPPTNTPVPPPPTAVPPTNTPLPPPPTSVSTSPLPAPTSAPQAETPPGRYEILSTDTERNCFDVGVKGTVKEKDNDQPVQFVTIRVKGDDDDFKGPFIGQTDEEGYYGIYIGPLSEVGKVEFVARVIGGDNVEVEDQIRWTTSKDCEADGAIQVMEIDWGRKN